MKLSEGMQLIEKTWNHTQNQQKVHISGVGQQVYFLQVFTNFSNHRKKTNRAAVLSCRPLPTFLNTGKNRSDLPTIWNKDSFRHILKNAARSYEYLGSQFFRATSRLQSGWGAFDKSRLVMTLTNLGVKGIVCNFRLSLEGTTGKEIHE